jgi:BR serine/threonine kinase
VKEAIHKDTNQHFAVKIVKKSKFASHPDLEGKIRREIALMRIVDHPHILKLIEFFESPRYLFMVLELAPHGELFDYILSRPRLEPALALPIFRSIVYALEYLHCHAICHRDLKPENILLDSFDRPKIADFGLARWMRENIAETSCGSPHYAAPKIVRGLTYDGRIADIWSCGIVLFALLSGRLPFDDTSVRAVIAKIRRGRYVMPEFPEPLQDLVSRMLTVAPDKRIRIDEIKRHRAFFLDLPPLQYQPPTPLPIPLFNEPIDRADIDDGIRSILRSIGYESEDEIDRELTAETHTKAKVFFRMFTRTIPLDLLPWRSEAPVFEYPQNKFVLSPMELPQMTPEVVLNSGSLVHSPDSNPIGSMPLSSNWGVARTAAAGGDRLFERFDRIEEHIEVIMADLQVILQNREYVWFHPDDMSIVAGDLSLQFFLLFQAEFMDLNAIALTVQVVRGGDRHSEFTAWMQELHDRFGGAGAADS